MRNWFYVLLIPVGTLFAVTAFAYGTMAFQAVNAVGADALLHARHPLFQWLRRHGEAALLAELAVLGACTVLAIALDPPTDREAGQADRGGRSPTPPPSPLEPTQTP